MRDSFFFNDTATTEIYTLSLHDALPISSVKWCATISGWLATISANLSSSARAIWPCRSEEHTSELQSQSNLVCRLLLEKNKKLHTSLHDGARIHSKNQARGLASHT